MTVRELSRIAVTVGPGSFTGVRVGLAFARGLAIPQQVPVVGVTTLEVLAAGVAGHEGSVRVVLIDARRGQLYGQVFAHDRLAPLCEPFILAPSDAAVLVKKIAAGREPIFTGSGMPLAFPERADDFDWGAQQPDPVVLAGIASERAPADQPPSALYLRAADAKPATPPATPIVL